MERIMERLIDKFFDKINIDGKTNVFDLSNITKLKNVEINDESDKKLFIYKKNGIQIKNGIKFKITFFKLKDDSKIEKLFELNNVRIRINNTICSIFKFNDFWECELFDESSENLLIYFCKKLNIKYLK